MLENQEGSTYPIVASRPIPTLRLKLVKEDKIGGVFLCEINADPLPAAAKVVAVDVDISPFSTKTLGQQIESSDQCVSPSIF